MAVIGGGTQVAQAAGPGRGAATGCRADFSLTWLGSKPSTRTSLSRQELSFGFCWLGDRSTGDGASEAARRQRTDCTSTNGLVAPVGADPDTNRSAGGLHSIHVVGRYVRHARLVEFTGCRSDLSMHLREHVFRGRDL